MKIIIIKICLILGVLSVSISATGQKNASPVSNYLSKKLEVAEKQKDIESIGKLFLDDAIILLPDAPPIVGKKCILALYEFM